MQLVTTPTLAKVAIERTFAPELIRAVAIVLVIVIHVTCPYMIDYSSQHSWKIANIINSAARPCVPLFYMLTGSLLLAGHKTESTMAFYQKRFKRILIPFCFWAAVYFAWRHFHHGEAMSALKIINELYSGPIFYHYGFMYALVVLYLVTPFLRVLIAHSSYKTIVWFTCLWFVAQTVPPFVGKFCNIYCAVPIELVTRYVGFFTLGYCLTKITIDRAQAIFLVLLAAAGLGVTVIGTDLINYNSPGHFDEFFYDYLSPNVIVTSACLFLLLYNLGRQCDHDKSWLNRAIRLLGSASLGIYLMQSVVIEIVSLSPVGLSVLVYVPMAVVTVLLISLAVTLILRKIPLLKETV